MKRLFILLTVALISFTVSAQREITDTLNGAETVVFAEMLNASQVQVLCSNVGGTSDGSIVLKGSVDGVSYVVLDEKSGSVEFYPSDSLTIVDGAVWLVDIKGDVFNYYKVSGSGTASDSTLITINWSK